MRKTAPAERLFWASVLMAVLSGCGGNSAERNRPNAGGSGSGEAGSAGTGGAGRGGHSTGGQSGASSGASGLGGTAGASAAGSGSAGLPAAGGEGEGGAGGAEPCEEAAGCEPHESDVVLRYGSQHCPRAALTVTTEASYYIGGVNRFVLEFSWACSDLSSTGQPSRAKLQVRLEDPSDPPLGEVEHTFTYPPAAGTVSQYIAGWGEIAVRGSGVPEITSSLSQVESQLSIRRAEDVLIGSVRYVGTAASGSVELRAPFEVPAPTP